MALGLFAGKLFAGRGWHAGKHYWLALNCAVFNALIHCAWWGFISFQKPHLSSAVTTFVISLVIALGIWFGSNFFRFVGAALMVGWAGALLWPLVSAGAKASLLVSVFFIAWAALNLFTAVILLLSRKFAAEFAEQRKRQPRWKINLWRGLLAVIIAAMVVATANDIIHLAGN
jgi:hypothetical protein